MRILTVSDYESPGLWDYFTPEKLDGIELILSCGDLKPQYLSFLATFAHCPVLYVHGNHDGRYAKDPPLGCDCVDGMLYEYKGLRILGLGGSMRYSGGEHQYTERQMAWRARKLAFQIYRKKGFDILLAHAPGYDMVPCTDLAHMGFETFNHLLDKHHPALFIHGHTHRPAHYVYDNFTRTVIPDWDLDDKNRPRKGWVEINSAGEPQVVLSEHFF